MWSLTRVSTSLGERGEREVRVGEEEVRVGQVGEAQRSKCYLSFYKVTRQKGGRDQRGW